MLPLCVVASATIQDFGVSGECMSDESEKPPNLPNKQFSGSSERISQRDRAMFGNDLLTSVLDEATGLLKLYFGLQTGAVVLFVKVLTDVCVPTHVLAALATSIILFGASALVSLKLLQGMVEIRAKMLRSWADEGKNWSELFDAETREWQGAMGKAGKVMEWSFRLAILFAVIFVLGVLRTR